MMAPGPPMPMAPPMGPMPGGPMMPPGAMAPPGMMGPGASPQNIAMMLFNRLLGERTQGPM